VSHPNAPLAEGAVVIVPTFNERENIAPLVAAIFSRHPGIRLLIVDDDSPDGTAQAVRELQPAHPNLLLLHRRGEPSFARAYCDGFRSVLGNPWCRAIVTMDADFSHDPAVIGSLLAGLAAHDAVIGSRYTPGGKIDNWGLHRRLLSRCGNLYVRTVLGFQFKDATAGFIAMRPEALRRVPLDQVSSQGYAFLVELKMHLVRTGARIAEFPITFNERREGQSKMSGGKIWEALLLPWRIRFRGPRARPSADAQVTGLPYN
jgi:dolichol-phosphate mannosyltransferase